MRLLRVYIDGYRNLKNVTVDFDKRPPQPLYRETR